MPDKHGHDEPDDPCRVCGAATGTVVNIALRMAKVCDRCCRAITKQTVTAWADAEHAKD